MNESKVKIVYPQLFRDKCKELFPNEEWLHEALKNGEDVGSRLDSLTDSIEFHPHMITSCFEASDADLKTLPESLQGLYVRAVLEQEKQHIWGWYMEIMYPD